MDKLAINGGSPVRKKPFPPHYVGASFYGDEELAELTDVIKEKSPFRHYGIGNPQKVLSFESEVREYLGCKFALAVSSGSGALNCAIAALGIGPGDEVILPSFGWFSDYFAITHLGAMPVFADIDETLSLDPADFERKITDKTKAVIVVDFQGCPANMEEIMKVAKARGIKVIEDVAQAFGGSYKGKKLGTFGDIGVASFQQNKMITSGEGGLVVTDNEEYFARAVRYHDLGSIRQVFRDQLTDKSVARSMHDFAGLQFRMSELQGAVLRAQLRKLDMMIDTCRKHHKKIRDHFKDNKHFKIRYVDGDCGITLFLLFPTKEEAKNFGDALKAEGIMLGATSACRNLINQYPITTKKLAHPKLPPFGEGFDKESMADKEYCPNTDGIVERYIAMAIGPRFSDEDVDDIISAIEKVDKGLY